MQLIFNKNFILIITVLVIIYVIGLISFDYYLNKKIYYLEKNINSLILEKEVLKSKLKSFQINEGQNQKENPNPIINFEKGTRTNITLLMSILFLLPLILVSILVVALLIRIKQEHKTFKNIVSSLSHEFKTPLTSIKLISEMIYKNGNTLEANKLRNYSLIIQQETDKLIEQTKLFLNSTISEESEYKPKLRAFNLHGIIEHTVKNYYNLYEKNEIEIKLNLKATDDNCLVDRNHMINILTNIIENSNKYSINKPVEINITTKNEFRKLIIEITDNGIGISEKDQKHIFKKFYRVINGNLHDKPGYGIGLYYVKTTLGQMNAKISVKSKLDMGTKFIIELKNFKLNKNCKHGNIKK